MSLRRVWPEPFIGVGTLGFAGVVLVSSWARATPSSVTELVSLAQLLAALCFAIAVVVSYRFPIYVRHNTKVCVSSVPLYLMTVFLAPPLAATTAGLGIVSGEMAVRKQRGSDLSHVATHTGRWTVLALAGSLVAHVALISGGILARSLLLVAPAALLLLGDILTLPLALSPITGEKPGRLIVACLREGGAVEGAQYMVGLLGAIVVVQQVWALSLLAVPTVLVYLFYRKEVDPDTRQLLESMADAVDLRSPYTVEHSRRVAELTKGILDELGMHGQEAAYILAAARVHDIGKTRIPDQVLLKTGPLTAEDRAVLQMHAAHGAELLERYPDFARAVDMVRHHHERWDGSGYPDGLRGVEIPFGARVIAVAESFDSMTTDQVHRRAVSPARAAAILRFGGARQWDPVVVQAFLRSIQDRCELPVESLSLPEEARESPTYGVVQPT